MSLVNVSLGEASVLVPAQPKEMISVGVTPEGKTKVLKRKTASKSSVTFAEVMQNSTVVSSGCIEWQRAKNKKGYGVIRRKGRCTLVTRWIMHVLYKFDLASELFVLHRCDNPPCVNPEHLYLGTEKDNTADKVRARRHNFGTKVPSSVLNETQVLEILKLRNNGLLYSKIGKMFGVHKETVRQICLRNTWRHVAIGDADGAC